MGFWRELGFFVVIVLLLLPAFFCIYGQVTLPTDYSKIAAEKIINESSPISFLNPVLGQIKAGATRGANFLTEKLEIVIGWRQLNGEFQCSPSNITHYALIGFFVAFWIFIGFAGFCRNFGYTPLETFGIWLRGMRYDPRAKVFLRWKNMSNRSFNDLWLIHLSSHWQKSLVIVVTYTYLMSFVPFVNQVLKIITLEFLQPNWFILSLIIAFEIGFFPSFIQQYSAYNKRQERLKEKLAIKVYERAAQSWFKG